MSPRRIGWITGVVAIVLVAMANGVGIIVGVCGLVVGIAANRVAAHGRDGPERLLALATAGLLGRRAEWGAAMRAELCALDDADARRRYARSASAAAFGQGLGIRIAVALGTGAVAAAATLTASRLQLQDGEPGILGVTVPLPAILVLAVALVAAWAARSFRVGLETGALALVASFGAVSSVVAVEGLVWMDRRGVFVLDGDPPRHVVERADVVFDLFSSGMWVGHLIFWLPWPAIGAALGVWIGARRGGTGMVGARSRLDST